MTNKTNKKGFTIIEVVLVLAIAGLIFLMVFIALPTMQISQRDTQRRDDLARFASQISQYSANNRGKVPTTQAEWESFSAQYMNVDKKTENEVTFVDPDGQYYQIIHKGEASAYSAPTTFDHKIYIYNNATCDGEKVVASTGTRKVAFIYKLEGAGVYCGNN